MRSLEKRRVAWVLVDGLGDVDIPGKPVGHLLLSSLPSSKHVRSKLSIYSADIGFRTPLDVAHTPAMDAIAQAGWIGLQDTAEPGLACGSDTAHLTLLGYPPIEVTADVYMDMQTMMMM